jgi:hypothetical protein
MYEQMTSRLRDSPLRDEDDFGVFRDPLKAHELDIWTPDMDKALTPSLLRK